MILMVIVLLVILGLGFGSFVNALVWRLHEQSNKKKPSKDLSIMTGRSMCPSCKHQLGAYDLVPVFSWLLLKGKCRYCGRPISWQYPLVEASTALLFVASYLWWPYSFSASQIVLLAIWLALTIGLIALFIYDLRWQILPNRIIYPLSVLAGVYAVVSVATSSSPLKALLNVALAVLVGGGIFYALFMVSAGKWIGGGDVKLGWVLGLIAGTAGRSLLLIFLAALAGSLVSLPLLATNKLKRTSRIPFGPFLIIAMVIVQLFGHAILLWYQQTFFSYTT